MNGLTEAQERCLDAIIAFNAENGAAPTRQELAKMIGERSTNGVNQKLQQLEKKGYVRIQPVGKRRNISVVRGPERQLELFKD